MEERLGWVPKIIKLLRRRVMVSEGEEPATYPPGGLLIVLTRGQVAERKIAWIYRSRRMSRDYELLPETGEVLSHAAVVRFYQNNGRRLTESIRECLRKVRREGRVTG